MSASEQTSSAGVDVVRGPKSLRPIVVGLFLLAFVVVLMLRYCAGPEGAIAERTGADRVECEQVDDDSIVRLNCTLYGPDGPVLEGCDVSLGVLPIFSRDFDGADGCSRVLPRTEVPGVDWDEIEAALASLVSSTSIDFDGSHEFTVWDYRILGEAAKPRSNVEVLGIGRNALRRSLSAEERASLVHRPGRRCGSSGACSSRATRRTLVGRCARRSGGLPRQRQVSRRQLRRRQACSV